MAAAPIIIELCIQNNFPVMVIFAVLSSICLVLSNRLPETLGMEIQDEVEELKGKETANLKKTLIEKDMG